MTLSPNIPKYFAPDGIIPKIFETYCESQNIFASNGVLPKDFYPRVYHQRVFP